jgi:polar amino acid transport system substrate-binding protein
VTGGRSAIAGGAALVAAMALPACSTAAGVDAAAIPKVLHVGSDIEYAPIEFFKENTATPQGLDYDLAQALGAQLGVKVKYQNDTDFAGIIGALRAGRFDVVMSAMNDTGERRGRGVDFVDYFRAGSSILVRKGNPDRIATLDDLCGRTVAVQQGTTQDTDVIGPEAAKCPPGKKLAVLRFEKDADALQQVKNGRAVADVEDFPVAAYNAVTSGHGADFDVVPRQVGDIGAYGIAVPHDRPALRDRLRAALQAIIDDGDYGRILARWNVVAGAVKTATVNGAG